MSSAQSPTEYEKYYVPESSSLAVRATIGLVLTVFGGGLVLNERTFTDPKFGGEISEYFGIPFNLVYGFADQDASWR